VPLIPPRRFNGSTRWKRFPPQAVGKLSSDWQSGGIRLKREKSACCRAECEPDLMNLPNKLTISRFVLTVAFLAVMFSKVDFHESIALALFIAGGVTDFLDGHIARRHQLITNFGILMDPLADKIMVCSAFIAFVGLNWIPAWMVVIIVARELAITGLRLLAASKNVVLAAEGYGKHKTISQIIAIISILVLASYAQWGSLGTAVFGFQAFGGPWVKGFTTLSIWVAVVLTFISGWLYLWRNRALYLYDM
jgi:CDP-diacylglycerol---glycerol-3-phosphate 3-phosphatidyltransferase